MTCESLSGGRGTAVGLLAEVSDALDFDLEHLVDDDWHSPVILGWNVQDVVAHLGAVHACAAKRIHGSLHGQVTHVDLIDETERAVRLQREKSPEDTRKMWRTSVECLHREIADADPTVTEWVWGPTTIDDLIVDRAFETWIHANDIRRSTNRSSLDPSGEHFRVLSDFGVANWPAVLPVNGLHHRAVVTVNLAGPGGGTRQMTIGDVDERAGNVARFTLNCAARDLCLLMGDRLDPADFAYTVRGLDDEARVIVDDLVAHGATFARP